MIILNPVRRLKHRIIGDYIQFKNQSRFKRKLKLIKSDISNGDMIDHLFLKASSFVDSLRVKEKAYGRFLYKKSSRSPILYASIFAALYKSLVGELESLSIEERGEWIKYINSHQCPDGLYRDPLVSNQIAETEDWWGWRHLTLLALMAVSALGGKPKYSLNYLENISNLEKMKFWLDTLNWRERASFTSNTLQNYCAAMQYARDFLGEDSLDKNIKELLALIADRCDPATGLWGSGISNSQVALSEGVQAGYHFWLLYWYDGLEIPFPEKVFDSIKKLQNKNSGGFDLIHDYSSACQDIDGLHPLIKLASDYKRLEGADLILKKSLPWVIYNYNSDGGACFRRGESFLYGHELMSSDADESTIFATWFRSLCLSYMCEFLSDRHQISTSRVFTYLGCPGLQYSVKTLGV